MSKEERLVIGFAVWIVGTATADIVLRNLFPSYALIIDIGYVVSAIVYVVTLYIAMRRLTHEPTRYPSTVRARQEAARRRKERKR